MIDLSRISAHAGAALLLHRVSARLAPACIAVIGPNGAGKSTLLHLCADGGRSRPELRLEGEVKLDGLPLRAIAPALVAQRRAFLPQQHADDLPLPVAAVLELACWPHGGGRLPPDLLDEAVARWELATLLQRPHAALSGGERQRVQLARTWLQLRLQPDPAMRVWLLDEPQGALDLPHQQALLSTLRDEARHGALVMFSTHDVNFALRAADRILAMKDGRLVADATSAELADPALLQAIFDTRFVRLDHPGDGRPLLVPA